MDGAPWSPDEIDLGQVVKRLVELESELAKKTELATVLKTSITLQHEINNPLTGIIGNLEYLEDWENIPQIFFGI